MKNKHYTAIKKLKTDKEKWKYLIDNPDCGLIVMLDNDETYITVKYDAADDDEYDWLKFNEDIGDRRGLKTLLNLFGIKSQRV